MALSNAGMSEPDICIVFGKNVRRIRRGKDKTQEDLADDAGLHRTYVSALERGGGRNPSIRVADRIAKALDVSLAQLLEPAD